MRSKSFIQVVAAVLGLSASTFSTAKAFDGFTRGLKRRQWHDSARVQAAEAKRERRCMRNLRNGMAGGYGQGFFEDVA
jgi:hypothetical protein